MKFISPDVEHRYIRKLAQYLDIQFTTNYDTIRKSDRTFLIWNPKGSLAYNKKDYIDKCNYYKELKYNKKEAYCVERGALPDSIFIDRNGFLVDSTSYNIENWNKPLNSEQLIKVKEYIENFKNGSDSLEPQTSNRVSYKEFNEKLNINKIEYDKVIFVPLQMHNDTVTLLWCDWIKNVKNFINLIERLASNNPDYLFVIKNHPNETQKYITEKQNIVIADDVHYKDCIDYSDCVLTINSSVGLQSMMWFKKAIIVGKSFYQFNNINYKADSFLDIENKINSSFEPDKNLIYKFIYYLKFQFYTTCIMETTGRNCSKPKEMYKVSYEDTNGNRISAEHKITKCEQKEILLELIDILPKYALLNETCLECIQYCELRQVKDKLFIGCELTKEVKLKLLDNDYEEVDKNVYQKSNVKVFFGDLPKNVKQMTIYGKPVNVPLPVVPYLKNLYGENWKTHKLKKQEVVKKKEKLNIVYTFNNYGWVFEFEARYYQKYSNHNIIPIHQDELFTTIKTQDIDLIVVPSAWHYEKDLKLNNKSVIKGIKDKGIKIVSQYNSHIEEKFNSVTADFVMPSSKYLFDALKKKYNYKNMAWFPHFVDTSLFVPNHKWNGFTVGFCGNFENIYKRPQVIKKLENDYKFLKRCDYKGFLNKDRKHSDMVNFYNDIDILVMPSLSEGTPYPLIEAMSCCKIVFITDTGLAPYLLDNFFIIPNKNDEYVYNELVKRLNILKEKPVRELLDIGLQNRLIAKRLDWKKNVESLDSFYNEVYYGNIKNIELESNKMVRKLENNI